MEQGNEGDGIVLFQYRQIDCDLPDSVLTIGQITPDQLIDIGNNIQLIDTSNNYNNYNSLFSYKIFEFNHTR